MTEPTKPTLIDRSVQRILALGSLGLALIPLLSVAALVYGMVSPSWPRVGIAAVAFLSWRWITARGAKLPPALAMLSRVKADKATAN